MGLPRATGHEKRCERLAPVRDVRASRNEVPMKRLLCVGIVAAALGVWSGVRAWQSSPGAADVEAGLALVISVTLVLCLRVWYRARPGSGDAVMMPLVAVILAGMLVGILPRVIWPTADGIHLAGSIASMIVTAGVLVAQIRRRRGLRRGAGSA